MTKKGTKRPQFITIIAIITFAIGILGIILSFTFYNRIQEFLIGVLGIVVSIGLLQMKKWALWGYIVSLLVAIFSTCIYAMTSSLTNSIVLLTFIASLFIIAIRIYFVYYIFMHRKLFVDW